MHNVVVFEPKILKKTRKNNNNNQVYRVCVLKVSKCVYKTNKRKPFDDVDGATLKLFAKRRCGIGGVGPSPVVLAAAELLLPMLVDRFNDATLPLKLKLLLPEPLPKASLRFIIDLLSLPDKRDDICDCCALEGLVPVPPVLMPLLLPLSACSSIA